MSPPSRRQGSPSARRRPPRPRSHGRVETPTSATWTYSTAEGVQRRCCRRGGVSSPVRASEARSNSFRSGLVIRSILRHCSMGRSTAVSIPCLVTICGPSARVVSRSSLNLALILSQKVCAGRSRTNVPTPGYNIQSLFRILPQHTVALRCAKSLELPQNGFLRGNQPWHPGTAISCSWFTPAAIVLTS